MLPRRGFLALLGLVPLAAPAALAAAMRPAAPALAPASTAGVAAGEATLTIAAQDQVSELLRAIAARHGLTYAALTGDFSATSLSTLAREEALRASLRPETAPRGSAGGMASAVRTMPMAGVSSQATGRGPSAPAPFGRR